MRKLLSFSAVALLALGAQAQNSNRPYRTDKSSEVAKAFELAQPTKVSLNGLAKTTATPFWTESFGSGTATTLPTGWSAAGNSNFAATWKWRNAAATGSFPLPAINSTTKANGWMIYDSDSIGNLNPTAVPLEGTLTSPLINCTGHSTVAISFQQLFRRFQDSCFLEVSTSSNFASFTRFPVLPNNTIATNTTLANPTLTTINITSVAQNQPSVYIRFRYLGLYAGGSYSWLIDDIAASELDPVDLELSDAAFIMTKRNSAGNDYTSFGTFPRQLADSVFPVVRVTNRGSTAPANTNFTANVNGPSGTSVYSKSLVFTNVPSNAMDSIVDFSLQAGFVPSTTGNYVGSFGVNLTGEATPANNVDTATFAISDSVLSRNDGTIIGGYFLHRPSSNANGEGSFFVGTIMEIPAGKSDTLTGASVIFNSTTTVGTKAAVQIYKFENAQWNFITLSNTVTLTANDISTAQQSKFAYFPMGVTTGNAASFVLDGGTDGATYAAVVQGSGNPATSTAVVSASASIAETYLGISGVSYTSNNDGAIDFASAGLPSGIAGAAPWVRMHFSNFNTNVGVNTIKGLAGSVNAYPNPATNELYVPVTLSKTADLSVTLSNPMGQVIARQDFGKVAAGQAVKASFNTAAIANGIYFYTVEVAGERLTNRVVVSH